MLERHAIEIARVYVPAKRMRTLDPARVAALAEDMLENGQTTPIRVREDGNAYVLIEGLHRLEALRALGEERVEAYVVEGRLH